MKKSRFLFGLVLMMSVMNQLNAATTIQAGNISGKWSVSGSPYLVYGNIIIPSESTLSIDPGVQIIFQGHYSLTVEGRIMAEGSVSSGILFTINDTTGAANRSTPDGTWAGIIFKSYSSKEDTSKFIHCTISYARKAIYISSNYNVEVIKSTLINNYSDEYGASIYVDSPYCYVLVKECMITKNISGRGPGVFCRDGININILNNEISYNKATETAGAICYMDNQGGIISGNIIKFNTCTQFTGAIECSGENIEISSNIIHDNTGRSAGGIFFSSTYNSVCINNTFINNQTSWNGGGIECWESDFEISNNVICNNASSNGAGGINIRNSRIILTGNTICNNRGSEGGGLNFTQSETKIYNTILWGNTCINTGSQVYINDNFSSPGIYYSDIQSGTSGFGYSPGTSFHGEYLNNIQQTPQFTLPAAGSGVNVNAMSADWSIKTTSPCINAGIPDLSDLEIPDFDRKGNIRVRNGRIDIGAYESHIDRIFASGTIAANQEWIADIVEVTGDIYIPDNITLRIPAGTQVVFSGHFKISVHGTLLANGTQKENIIFEVKDTTGFSQRYTIAGSWDGIDFNNGPWTWKGGANGIMNDNDSSVLAYCKLQHAKSNNYGGAILIDHFSRIRIDHCIIQHCGSFGIDDDNGAEYNGGGFYCVYGNPILRNTRIENNYSQYWGSGIFMENSDILIENCTISHNRSYENSAAGIYMQDAAPVISNTLISDNQSMSNKFSGGIFCDNSSPEFTNCKIINNRNNAIGAAAYISNGQPAFINCLIANNYSTNNGGIIYLVSTDGAIFINNTIVSNSAMAIVFDASAAKIYNTIIWGNYQQLWLTESVQTRIDIYNSIIQNGLLEVDIAEGLIRNGINISEDDPQFINPSEEMGYDEDAILKDYTVSSFSPAINTGTRKIREYMIPGKDLNGNPRINADSVDIGAFEHQGDKIIILEQPTGGTFCEGDTMKLTINVNDSAHVQWQKDGVEIPGANAYVYKVDSVSSIDQGNYRCLVSNAYGLITSEQTTVFVTQLPGVKIIENNPWVIPGSESMIKTIASGTNIKYHWKKDDQILQGENLPEYHFIPAGISSEGVYTCVVSNSCKSVESDPVLVYLAPQICMVTVSTVTGNNLVVWEKNTIAPILQYKIYRESKYAGIYDPIATLPFDALSIFDDTTADPTVQAYLYKITAVDTSGYETDINLCKIHKTIHLLVTTNPETNSTQLDWDRYVGFDYGTYEVFRSETKTNFMSIHDMSSSTSTWADPDPGTGTMYYRIAALRPEPCYPGGTGKKADSGPYSHSMSNIEDNRLQTGKSDYPENSGEISINPNPFKESTIIQFNNSEGYTYSLYMIDLTGKICRIVNGITESGYVLERGNLKEGLYFIEMRGPTIFRGKIIIE